MKCEGVNLFHRPHLTQYNHKLASKCTKLEWWLRVCVKRLWKMSQIYVIWRFPGPWEIGHLVVNALHSAQQFKCAKIWNSKIFYHNRTCYLENHCTNTRLVCTHLNAFFMLNPNMVMTIWILKFFWQKVENLIPVVCLWYLLRIEMVTYVNTADPAVVMIQSYWHDAKQI